MGSLKFHFLSFGVENQFFQTGNGVQDVVVLTSWKGGVFVFEIGEPLGDEDSPELKSGDKPKDTRSFCLV